MADKKLPPPGGYARKAGEPEGRCPYCSFQPTSDNDFCDTHKPKYHHRLFRLQSVR